MSILRATQLAISLGTLCAASGAYADTSSLFTLGAGARFGVMRGQDPRAEAVMRAQPEFELELRLFRVMAFELGAMPLPANVDSLVFESNFRWSARLYLIPL